MSKMKVSNCCGAPPYSNGDSSTEDYGICPACKEHCEYVEHEDNEVAEINGFDYVCVAYRYGHRESHSYVVDICKGIDTAKEAAEKEVTERGGKYSVVVFGKNNALNEVEEVYIAHCPEHYTKGTKPPSPLIESKYCDELVEYLKRIEGGERIDSIYINAIIGNFIRSKQKTDE